MAPKKKVGRAKQGASLPESEVAVQKGFLHVDGKCIPMLTTQDMMRLFRVTYMTIYNWRRYKGLPCVVVPQGGVRIVRFNKDDVRIWAAENDKDYLLSVAREFGVE